MTSLMLHWHLPTYPSIEATSSLEEQADTDMADEFKHESLQDLRSIGQYLGAITEGLESGRIELSDGNGQLALFPAGLLSLELRAKRRGSHAKLQIKLTWTEEKGKPLGPSLRVGPEPRTERT
jgi:amphi-Trp domain-containing protein